MVWTDSMEERQAISEEQKTAMTDNEQNFTLAQTEVSATLAMANEIDELAKEEVYNTGTGTTGRNAPSEG
ncbi:hypothetical protein N7493_007272 [Penicillium malachiteum]|uniref:Uncharacterized protein n=1 Tax=Penicillium malachiteum TaxID=1324776 RepID=A0AAD6MUV6_9EURO|nr:hypothetical protein N7493_007272 [Penicillium malachiteum]